MYSFKNANIYVEGKGIIKMSLAFTERIESIGTESIGNEISLPKGAVVVPGFIDCHVHGAGGADAMDGTPTALDTIAETLAAEGTARFLATTMTQSRDKLCAAATATREYMQDKGQSCAVLGMHLEGPFISKKHIGAQPLEYVTEPNIEFFDELDRESGNSVKAITLAPETNGACEFIKEISKSGVRVSIGHTDATYADVVKAVECGAKSVTHTYNAQRGIHHREIGTAGAAMLIGKLYCELIADCIHVSVPAMKLLIKNKRKDKLLLITDAIRAKGIGDGVSELGGQRVTVKGSEARLDDGTLAGSVLKMNIAVKNLVKECGVTFERAINCATVNPARYLGISRDYGSIKEGKVADFAVLDSEFNVIMTIRGGQVVYEI